MSQRRGRRIRAVRVEQEERGQWIGIRELRYVFTMSMIGGGGARHRGSRCLVFDTFEFGVESGCAAAGARVPESGVPSAGAAAGERTGQRTRRGSRESGHAGRGLSPDAGRALVRPSGLRSPLQLTRRLSLHRRAASSAPPREVCEVRGVVRERTSGRGSALPLNAKAVTRSLQIHIVPAGPFLKDETAVQRA